MENNSYWFFLEPYVYVSIKSDKVLLYNTLDANRIVSNNKEVYKLVTDIFEPENGGVVSITSDALESDAELRKFIDEVRRYFMGDIIDSRLSNIKPVQLLPILNVQSEIIKNQSEDYVGDGIATNLRSLVVYTHGGKLHDKESVANYSKQINFPCSGYSSALPIESLLSFLRHADAIGVCLVQLMGGNVFEYDGFDTLMDSLPDMNIEFIIGARYQDVDSEAISKIPTSNVRLNIFADLPVDMPLFDRALDVLTRSNLPYKISFIVASNENVEMAESIVADRNISDYDILPVYTGGNYDFFRETVFMSEADIFDEPIPMGKIFANQAINNLFWGILIVTPDGKVYANLNMEPVGTIDDPINEMLYEEITKGTAWKKTRTEKPCSECLYQYLCPSPSNYEIVIGQSNLCCIS